MNHGIGALMLNFGPRGWDLGLEADIFVKGGYREGEEGDEEGEIFPV